MFQHVSAQYYQTQISKITDEQGNSPSATFSIVESSKGFIWFGTIDGLYRYDGYNFKIFRNNPKDTNTLANNTIRAMTLYQDSLLWIGTQGGGLDCFNMHSEKFIHFKHTGQKQNEISGNSLWSLFVDRSGNLWAGVSGIGIDRLDLNTMQFTHFKAVEFEGHLRQEQTVRAIIEDSDGTIWAGLSDNGFSRINPITGECKQYSHDFNNNQGLISNWVYDILMGNDGRLWIASYGGGINIFDPLSETYEYIRQKNGNGNTLISDLTYSITERIPGEFWIATEYGLSAYTAENNHFRNFQQSSYTNMSLSENRTRKVFVDKRGILWVGNESGVDKIVLQSKFELHQHIEGQSNTLRPGIVRAIMEDRIGDLWIGLVDNGLVKYSKSSDKYKTYLHNNNDPNSISGNNIDVIFQDKEGTIWVGEWNTGLMKYNKNRDNFVHVASSLGNERSLSDSRIQTIQQDKPGVLWIGTEQGINRYDVRKNAFSYYKHEADNPNSLSGNSIQSRALVFDNNHDLWVGTWSFGLNKLEFIDSTQTIANISHWLHDPKNPSESLTNDNVLALHFDKKGILWIGTFGGGLSRFNPHTEQFKNYTTDDGLPNNIIFAILEDNDENLWLSTDNGISRFNPKSETFLNFLKSDGLQDDHFFWGAAHKGKSGKLYFGGINGINSFYPEHVKPDTNQARPSLVDIKLFNESIHSTIPIHQLDRIELSYKENFISFEFTALDFIEPSKNRFLYKLEGFDKDWMASENSNNAYYTNLPHGSYTFKLQASNNDGIWSDDILSFNLIIIPPWWKTWIAKILFFLSAITIIFQIFYFRFRRDNTQKMKLKEMVFERTTELHELNAVLEERAGKDRNSK